MNNYQRLLIIAREQAQAVTRGDFEQVALAFDERAMLLSDAPEPSQDDILAIREVLSLDRQISGAIRERMIEIRDQVLEGQHGRRALDGYSRPQQRRPLALDRLG
jgi:hypothetical protein